MPFSLRSYRRHLPMATVALTLALGACAGPGSTDFGFEPFTSPDSRNPLSPHANLGDLAANPSHFKGLAAQDVVAALGDPNYRRRETPAEVWQYYGPGCVLDLFLYDERDAQRVAYAEVRDKNLGQAGGTACLSQLLDGRRGEKSS